MRDPVFTSNMLTRASSLPAARASPSRSKLNDRTAGLPADVSMTSNRPSLKLIDYIDVLPFFSGSTR